MAQQDLYIGLGSMAYALAKSDGCLQAEERNALQGVMHGEPYGEIALYVLDLKNQYKATVEEAYQFAFRRFSQNRRELDQETKTRFHRILKHVAAAHNGTSGKEKDLLRRFQRDLNRL
jgi:uncharacterized tellurite resistance protein B-like protein